MWQDPIVEEVRQAREAYAAQFNYDLQAMFRDLKEQEERNQAKKVSFTPKRIAPIEADIRPALSD